MKLFRILHTTWQSSKAISNGPKLSAATHLLSHRCWNNDAPSTESSMRESMLEEAGIHCIFESSKVSRLYSVPLLFCFILFKMQRKLSKVSMNKTQFGFINSAGRLSFSKKKKPKIGFVTNTVLVSGYLLW